MIRGDTGGTSRFPIWTDVITFVLAPAHFVHLAVRRHRSRTWGGSLRPLIAAIVQRPDYPQIRSRAHELATVDAVQFLPDITVRVTDIDASAVSAWADTWKGHHPSGYGGYEWPYLWHRYCRQEYRNFHCALWHGPMLCALGIGTVPRGHSHLTMHYLEARPQGQPFKGHVARIALGSARYYAVALGIPQIRLENPAPGLAGWYRDLGFSLAFQQGAIRYLALNLPTDQS